MPTKDLVIPFEVSTLRKVMTTAGAGAAASAALGSITRDFIFPDLLGGTIGPAMVGGLFSNFTTIIFIAVFYGFKTGRDAKLLVEQTASIDGGIAGGIAGGVVGSIVGFATDSPAIGTLAGALTGSIVGGAYYAGISFFNKLDISHNREAIADSSIDTSLSGS